MVLRIAITVTLLALVASAMYLLSPLLQLSSASALQQLVLDLIYTPQFWLSLVVGMMASVIDGALGMAYGVSATTFLLSTGASPVLASASVHIAEVFTTGFSGLAHARAGNVNVSLFLRLLIPGIIGGILGTLLITSVDVHILKPVVSVYLLLMGITILFKAWRHFVSSVEAPQHVSKLAFVGGFVDAAGGGGWGPVVTSSLIGSGNDPRTTIGSVNFAEFFVSFATAATFTIIIQTGLWVTVIGLIIGGLFAAPFAAQLCKRIPAKTLMILVGCLIVLLSSINLTRWLLLS